MAVARSRKNLADLSPEQRAKVESMIARRHTPEARAEEILDREELAEEYLRNGKIEATGEPIDPETLIRFRQLFARLREHREGAGISLATISERSGIDQPALSRLENGRSNPTLATLSRYAQALDVVLKLDYEIVNR